MGIKLASAHGVFGLSIIQQEFGFLWSHQTKSELRIYAANLNRPQLKNSCVFINICRCVFIRNYQLFKARRINMTSAPELLSITNLPQLHTIHFSSMYFGLSLHTNHILYLNLDGGAREMPKGLGWRWRTPAPPTPVLCKEVRKVAREGGTEFCGCKTQGYRYT